MAFARKSLMINGAERIFVYDPQKDSLADVLRRLGLTGTKIGCNIGVCGSCSVILNGELIRSCVKKVKSIEQFSSVLTIEGIGTPNHLHPLQLAFCTYGAVQCGFCSPGFIVSAYALLQQNASPTRQQVREWFYQHKNLCRCTGYKQIVDAVMAAAAVMRGEKDMSDITYQEPADGKYYGSTLPRPHALAKVCGTCDFGDDVALKMPGETLHLAVVMPRTSRHARILSINTEEAEHMPGVFGVYTAKDVQGTNRINASITHARRKVFNPNRPVLCDEKIYRYGDVVAVVAADTRQRARAAAEAVKVELEMLPEYTSLLDVVLPGAVRVHDEAPNEYLQIPLIKGDEEARDVIDRSAYAVKGSFYTQKEPHLPIESDMVEAYFDEEGNLAVLGKAQAVYGVRFMIAKAVGVEFDKLRIITNPTGGSFGYSVSPSLYALAAVVALKTNMPVSLSLSYDEHQFFSGKRSATFSNARVACDENGMLTAGELHGGFDHGCYTESADLTSKRFSRFFLWPYNVPTVTGLTRVLYTNNTFGVAYRGFGMPQISTTTESLVDMLAEKAGIDPFEFRYRNIARDGQASVNTYPYREYPMEEIMNKMRPFYEEAVQRAKALDTPELRRGVGLAWGGYTCTAGSMDKAQNDLELNPDGSVTVYNTWEEMGQGGDIGTLTFVLEALRELKLKPEQIHLVLNDSFTCPDSGIAAASRSHIMNGNAIIDAADKMLAAMRKEDGSFRTYAEMKAEGLETRFQGMTTTSGLGLIEDDPDTGAGDPSAFYMYALFLAEVAVETATGKVTVTNYVCVDDIGHVGNALSVFGQAYGGISHSIGYALSENYEDDKKYGNVLACGIPSILDIPDDITVLHCENERVYGPYGSSGCSEAYQSSGHVAVLNAVYNACGVRIFELPATADKVKAGLEQLAAGGQIAPPEEYFFGGDMYEDLEEIKNNPVSK